MPRAKAAKLKNQRRATKKERQARTAQMANIYLNGGLTLQEIASLYGITRQAVSFRLAGAGVQMRPRRRICEDLDHASEELRRLYVEEFVSIQNLADRYQTSIERVRSRLSELGVTLRKGSGPKYPKLERMKVGESVLLPKPIPKRATDRKYTWHEKIYSVARRLGVRFSAVSVDDLTIKVTRVE